MPAAAPAVVLFDLDGTISDSAPGILASLRAAFAEMDVSPLDPVAERALLGPPLRDAFPAIVGADRVDEAITRYRRHYIDGGGMFDCAVYDGIPELLATAHDAGLRLAVATSKAEPIATRLIDHFGFGPLVEVVCGDDLAGTRGTKTAVVGDALCRLGDPDPAGCVMVGDRYHDVLGAAAHQVRTLGAGWGYGAPGELADAGALVVCDTPSAVGRNLAIPRPAD